MADTLIATIPLNERAELRVSLVDFDDRRLIDVRTFALDGVSVNRTRKGFEMRERAVQPLVDALLDALDRVLDEGGGK